MKAGEYMLPSKVLRDISCTDAQKCHSSSRLPGLLGGLGLQHGCALKAKFDRGKHVQLSLIVWSACGPRKVLTHIRAQVKTNMTPYETRYVYISYVMHATHVRTQNSLYIHIYLRLVVRFILVGMKLF